MRKYVLLLLALGMPALARAPASQNLFYSGDPGRSLALNIALATNLTDVLDGPLFDVKRSELPLGIREGDPAFRSAFELSSKGFPPMMGTVSTNPNHLPHPATRPQLIAWMPQGEVQAPRDAQARMGQILLDAYRRAAEEDLGWIRYEEQVGGSKLTLYKGGTGLCGSTYRCEIAAYTRPPEYSAQTPDFIGPPSSAYLWRNWQLLQDAQQSVVAEVFITVRNSDWSLGGHLDVPREELGWDRRQAALMASKYLPPWVYFYEPPDADHDYPCLLHGGEELLFVEPYNAVPAPAPAEAPAPTKPKRKKKHRT